jgi:hypothetical protein
MPQMGNLAGDIDGDIGKKGQGGRSEGPRSDKLLKQSEEQPWPNETKLF